MPTALTELPTHDGPADYHIFVQSKRFTERDAAALIVGAHGDHRHLAFLNRPLTVR